MARYRLEPVAEEPIPTPPRSKFRLEPVRPEAIPEPTYLRQSLETPSMSYESRSLPPSNFSKGEESASIDNLESVQDGIKKLGKFGGYYSAAVFHTALDPIMPPEQKMALWEAVRKSGDEAPLDEVSNIAGLIAAGYGGYEALKSIPEIVKFAKSYATPAKDWVENKLYRGTRELVPYSEEQLADFYANAPTHQQEAMRQSARTNETIYNAISRVHGRMAGDEAAQAESIVPTEAAQVVQVGPTVAQVRPQVAPETPLRPTEEALEPQIAPGVINLGHGAAPEPILPKNPPSPEYVQALASKYGDHAPFYLPGHGIETGTDRMAITAKKLGEKLNLTTANVIDAMNMGSRSFTEATAAGTPPEQAQVAANVEFWRTIPLRSFLERSLQSPEAVNEFMQILKEGDPIASQNFIETLILTDPETKSIFPGMEAAQMERLAPPEAPAQVVPQLEPAPVKPKYRLEQVSKREVYEKNKGPMSAVQFLKSIGKVNPDLAESADILEFERPDLINRRSGKSADMAREAFQEAGYLQEGSTIRDFLDLIHKEVREGKKQYSSADTAEAAEYDLQPVDSMSFEQVEEGIRTGQKALAEGKLRKSDQQRLAEMIDHRQRLNDERESGADFTPEKYEMGMAEERAKYGDQPQTPEFKKWFGASKVVDEQGKPLVVYHGSPEDFKEFDYAKIGKLGTSEGKGFYFTPEKKRAHLYSQYHPDLTLSKKGKIYPSYLSIQKPMSLNQNKFTRDIRRKILLEIEKKNPDALSNYGDISFEGKDKILNDALDANEGTNDVDFIASQINGGIGDIETVHDAVRKVTGYDGVYASTEETGQTSDVYVAFFPTQIKSAIGNRGTFDPENPNILKESGPDQFDPGNRKQYDSSAIVSFYEKNIKGTAPKASVPMQSFDVGQMPEEISKEIGASSQDVSISSKALKHIYDARPKVSDYIVKNLSNLINTDEVYRNVDVSDRNLRRAENSFVFVKKIDRQYATIIQVKNIDGKNEIVTVFTVKPEAIKKLEPFRVQASGSGRTALETKSPFPPSESNPSLEEPLPANGFSALRRPELSVPEKGGNVKGEEPTEAELAVPMEPAPPLPPAIGESYVTTKIKEEGFIDAASIEIRSNDDVAATLYHLENETYEKMLFMLLDEKNRVIGINVNSIGTINTTSLNTREIFALAMKAGAKKIIPIHNHPSGIVKASSEDIETTKMLAEAAKEYGIEVGDHIIIDHGEYGAIDNAGRATKHKFTPPKERPMKIRILSMAQEGKSRGLYEGKRISSSDASIDIVKDIMNIDQNSLVVVALDTQLQVNGIIPIGSGSQFGDEIIKPIQNVVVNHNAANLILTTRGKIGMETVKRLAKALEHLQIELLDVVMPSHDFTSKVSLAESRPDEFPKYRESRPMLGEPGTRDLNELIAKIKVLQKEKRLSVVSMARIRKSMNIETLKKAGGWELEKMVEFMQSLEPGDSFLSEKQLSSFKEMMKDTERPDLVPKRVLISQFGEKSEIMSGPITGKIANELMPTVDIKEGHPLITKIVDKAEGLLDHAAQEVERRNENFAKMMDKAEASRAAKLTQLERIKRRIAPQGKEIFEAMSGFKVDLTKEEAAVVAYLRNFFAKAKKDLELDRHRKNYITHMEKPLLEKIVDEGLLNAVSDMFLSEKKQTIPINVMLELDNIIGGEKFFKFALERKGWGKPTTNIRKILNDYSRLYETKMALDQVLPEGQAIVQLLLQPRSAKWTKQFLQNLKGRGLDHDFRTGKMGWLAKMADKIISLGYYKLLSLNYWSAIKNVVAGEANSFIYQDFYNFLQGKKRFVTSPLKAYDMGKEYGVFEGTYVDYAQQGIESFRKIGNLSMIGQQIGEVEIRGTLFAGELTEEEWNTGKISPERVRKIKNTIAITQGIFSKTESPLWLQTWYGRLLFQMNRWRITNAMLMRRLTVGAKEELGRGEKFGPNVQKLSKAFLLYGLGMYLSYEIGKNAKDKAKQKWAKVAGSMAESVNSVIETLTLKPIVDSLRNNPTYSVLAEIAFTIQELADYIGVPGTQKPKSVQFQKGIEDTYVAPIERIKELAGIQPQPKKKKPVFYKIPMNGSLGSLDGDLDRMDRPLPMGKPKKIRTAKDPQAGSLIEMAITYAKAIGTDPVTAFDRIFTNQKIRFVTNGTIVVERMPLEESQKVKEERHGKTGDFKLDHLIPLSLGGSNEKDNLVLVPTDKWASYTPVERHLGSRLRAGKISKEDAQDLIKRFKKGEITADQVLSR